MVGRKLRVTDGGHVRTPHCIALILNGEQGNGGITENRQVVLTELCEGLVGSRLQSVVKSRAMVNQAVMVGSVG
jgi:hypothetical protein